MLPSELSLRRYENRVALITAAASGLGRAGAFRLAQEGAKVMIWDRDETALAATLAEAAEAGLSIEGASFDQLDQVAVKQAVGAIKARFGRIDVLVNNLGGSLHVPFRFLDQSDADWHKVWQVNVTASVYVTREVVPIMQGQNYGRIINMGSKAGRFGSLFAGTPYVAAKGAMQAFTLQLAQEFGPFGITCNAVCPGAILTPRVETLLNERQSPEERQRVVESIPVRRQGKVEDIAAAIAYLASEEAGFVTGATLDVNGGQAMSI